MRRRNFFATLLAPLLARAAPVKPEIFYFVGEHGVYEFTASSCRRIDEKTWPADSTDLAMVNVVASGANYANFRT